MTKTKNDQPQRRRWRGARAACAVAAVVAGLSQAVAADNQPTSAAAKGTRVGLYLADVHPETTAPSFLGSLWNWLLRAAQPCTDPLLCGRSNSPVIDGAAIVMFEPLGPARPVSAAATGVSIGLHLADVRQDVTSPDFWTSLWNRLFPMAGGGGCPDWVCGIKNSPVIEGAAIVMRPEPRAAVTRSFHELNLHGLPNTAGFAVAAIHKEGVPYEIAVHGAAVSAQPRDTRGPRLTGAMLAGLVIELRDNNDTRYALRVADVGSTAHWVGPVSAFSTFRLTYTTHVGVSTPLCTEANHEAILFAGDRYDAARKTVTATGAAAEGWVNVACAGTAISKLFLIRHTQASQLVPTTPRERQAMLKMLTADVCGDGHSFTVPGQPLYWADARRITRFPDAPRRLEAVWNEHGAVCMNEPRRPELTAAIDKRCGPLPRCTSSSHGYVISANPRSSRKD